VAWARLALVLLVLVGGMWPVALLVAWASFAGGRFGWVTSALVFGVLGMATGWLAISRHWPVVRQTTSTVLAVVGVLLGVGLAHVAPPTEGRLRHEIEELVQPGWTLRDDSVDGNAICLDYCTSVSREYRVDASADDVLDSLRPDLDRRGFRPTPAFDADRIELAGGGGDIDLRLGLVRTTADTTTVYISASASG